MAIDVTTHTAMDLDSQRENAPINRATCEYKAIGREPHASYVRRLMGDLDSSDSKSETMPRQEVDSYVGDPRAIVAALIVSVTSLSAHL